MRYNIFETVVGFIVLLVAIGGLYYLYLRGYNSREAESYYLKANFQDVTGVSEGSSVQIAGVKIGSVDRLELDKENYLAKITLELDSSVKLPTDSSAKIISENLLGHKVVEIIPGGDDEFLATGEYIEDTTSALNLEKIINKFIMQPQKFSN
jgi:phospholipid/cholesterol/gamma-HCH transport system substrate-binding protein